MRKNQSSRRHFLKSTAGAAGAVAISSYFTARSWGEVVGANDAVRIATIGFKSRGGSHLSDISKNPGFRLTGLCDVDSLVLEAHAKKFPGVETYTDMRKLFESKNLDAVSIATPNHWHALAAIWAIQAGKDVYVEKPVSHNVSEGRRIVDFARKFGKIVQTGTQSRSSRQGIAQAVEYVRSGKIGKIKVARGLCYKRRASIGKVTAPTQPPKGLDFDLWTGPAEKLPIMREKLHYDWHWVWNTGNGDLGNQGIHEMDVARWFLGVTELSPKILSIGGRKGYIDDGETPNTLAVIHDYPEAPLIFEVRGLPSKPGANKKEESMDKYQGASVGIVIECEGGRVTVPSYGQAIVYDNEGKKLTEFKGSENHFANFLKAVHSRKVEDLNADILEGHLSSALCHTANISYRLGQQASADEIRQKIKGEHAMEETFNRMAEHLAANNVDINSDKLVLGAPLKMDGKAERFIDNDAANALLTRKYREPFVVPGPGVA